MKPYICIILADDEIDLLTVISQVKKNPSLQLLGAFYSAEEALKFINKNKIDVLFLDIEMPEINGLEFRKKVMEISVCIYITSYPEHAVESFELDTLDYIVKPLKSDRFSIKKKKIDDYLELKYKAKLFENSIGGDTIYIKEGHEQTKIKLHDILYLEALKDYTKIVTSQKKHCVLKSIGNILKENNFQSFIRVHKSYAVQKQYISKKNSTEIVLNNGQIIPVGRMYKENLNF
mgnify:FL=1